MSKWFPQGKTPEFPKEDWVKKQIKGQLKKLEIFYFMPSANGYGKAGIPDFICCANSLFIGIEAKRKDGEWSQYQQDRCVEILQQKGVYVLVDETGLEALWALLERWMLHKILEPGLHDFRWRKERKR